MVIVPVKKLIIHITPHVSGGLGAVLLLTLKNSINKNSIFRHEIIITDRKPLSSKDLSKFKKYKKYIHIKKSKVFLKKKIIEADILQVEFWNHPQIYEFLTSFKIPRSRLIVCSHISGFVRPQIINKNIINFADIFLSTSQALKQHPLFKTKKNINNLKKLRFVKFPIDFERFKDIKKKKHNGFNVTYIGTLDYHKLHRDFLKMSDAIKIPKINFLICGDAKSEIEKESKKYSKKKFKFLGQIKDVKKILEITDVFGYPLNKNHYGTGEQALLEAMYAKIPVVTFSNYAERAIIQNNKNGFLVKDFKTYKDTIEDLYNDKKKRNKIGSNAHKTILERYSHRDCFNNLEKIYKQLMLKNKKLRVFKSLISRNKKYYGSELFAESLGNKKNEFIKSLKNNGKSIEIKVNNIIKSTEIELKSKTKGSLFQYLYYFPKDPYLNFWAGLISLGDKNVLKNKYKSIPQSTYKCFFKALRFDKNNQEFKSYLKK